MYHHITACPHLEPEMQQILWNWSVETITFVALPHSFVQTKGVLQKQVFTGVVGMYAQSQALPISSLL